MKWFEIPESPIPKLRELQKQDSAYPLTRSEDAVLMYGGLGDPLHLTFDGRVLIEDWTDEFPVREANSLNEAAAAIIVGAKKRSLPELLALLPSRPTDAEDCLKCNKTGWINLGSETMTFICHDCGGLGWKLKENQQLKWQNKK